MKKILLFSVLLLGITINAQISWSQQNSAFPNASTGINTISIVDNTTAWALGYDGSAAAANYKVFCKTLNGGTTWTSGNITGVGTTSYLISDLSAISGDTAWIAATPSAGGNGGGIWKTTDGGATWTKQTTALFNSSSSFANVVHFWDGNNGFCMGDPTGTLMETYTTNDGGTTWTKLTATSIPATSSGEYGYVHNKTVAGDNVWCGTNKGNIYKTANKGITWTKVASPISDFGGATSSGSIALKDANTAWILDDLGNVRATTNGGDTWTTIATIVQSSDITFIPGTTNTLIAVGNGTGSAISYNGGTSWTTIEASNQLVSVQALNSQTIWGGSFNTSATVGGIYKLSSLLATSDVKLEQNFAIYPNPTTDFIHVKGNEKIKDVQVYDILGRKMNVNMDGNVADVKDLEKGTYIISIETEKGQFTKKFIKK